MARDYASALEHYKASLAWNPLDAKVLSNMAGCYQRTEQWDLCIQVGGCYPLIGPLDGIPLLGE